MKIKVVKQKKTQKTLSYSELEMGKLYNYTLGTQRGIVFVSKPFMSTERITITELEGADANRTWDENSVSVLAKFTLFTDTLQLTNE